MGDMHVEGRPLQEPNEARSQGEVVQKSAPSTTINASTKLPENAAGVGAVAKKAIPKETSKASAIDRVMTALGQSSIGKFFNAVAQKIDALFKRNILPEVTAEKLSPKEELSRLAERNDTQGIQKLIGNASPADVMNKYYPAIIALYEGQPDPVRAANMFLKEALLALSPEKAKEWSVAFGKLQFERFGSVFLQSRDLEEALAQINNERQDPECRLANEIRLIAMTQGSARGDRTLAKMNVAAEFVKAGMESLDYEMRVRELEIDRLTDPDETELYERELTMKNARQELQAFNALRFDEEALRSHLEALRADIDVLAARRVAVKEWAASPALQEALTK